MQKYGTIIRGSSFDREAYQTNEKRRTIEYQRELLSRPEVHIWKVPFAPEDVEEDNDSESDESDESTV